MRWAFGMGNTSGWLIKAGFEVRTNVGRRSTRAYPNEKRHAALVAMMKASYLRNRDDRARGTRLDVPWEG